MPTKLTPHRVVGTVQTTDGTATTVVSYTMPASSVLYARAQIMGLQSTFADAHITEGGNAFRSDATPTVSVVGAGFGAFIARGSWSSTIDNSGTSIRVRVTGAGATTINWMAVLEIWVYTP